MAVHGVAVHPVGALALPLLVAEFSGQVMFCLQPFQGNKVQHNKRYFCPLLELFFGLSLRLSLQPCYGLNSSYVGLVHPFLSAGRGTQTHLLLWVPARVTNSRYYEGGPLFFHLYTARSGVAECSKKHQEMPLANVGEYCLLDDDDMILGCGWGRGAKKTIPYF